MRAKLKGDKINMLKASCGCPFICPVSRKLPNGKVLIAPKYGHKCWPMTLHEKTCLFYKEKTRSSAKPAK